MNNISTRVEGSKLIIEVDTSKNLGPSSSGKTNLVANSGGFQAIPGTNLKLSMNVCSPRS